MRALVAALSASALLAACGGDDGDDDATPPDASIVGVPGTYTVTGVVRYEDKPPLEDGSLGAIAQQPARFVQVALIAEDDGAMLGMGVTDASGGYSFTFDGVGGEALHVTAIAFSTDPARPITVKNLDETTHAFGGETFGAGNVTHDVLVTVASKEAQAFNIYDQLVEVMTSVTTTMGTATPPRISAYWEDGSDDGTYYFNGAMHLLGLAADDDGFDDTVILHEAGHWVEDQIGRSDSPGGAHDGSPTDPRLAWSEGYSTYYAMSVRGIPIYMDSNAGGGWSYNADTSVTKASLQNPISQRVSEDMIAEILWDMGDGGAGDDDPLDGTHPPVLVVQPQYLKVATLRNVGTAGVDLVDMLDGWFVLGGLTSCAPMREIIRTTHTFPYDFNGPRGACPP